MKYQFIQDHKDEHKVTVMCDALDIKRSSYYDWQSRPESQREKQNRYLINRIRSIHSATRENYGALKTWKALRESGEQCGLHRVERLRRKYAIEAKRMRLFRASNSGRNNEPVPDNVLDRNFHVKQQNRVWVGDITFITTRKGVLFLATVIDLYSRKVVGWSMSDKQNRHLVKDALMMAINSRNPKPGLIHHTDQGIQYSSGDYKALLETHDMVQSMSRKGNCHDNAVAESFFSHLKNELIYHKDFSDRDHARSEIFDYIEVFYNRQRIHQTLGFKSPNDYEMINVA
ncbi:MAG: IS3 family transposase [Gammaproteobacteria bacterium]|nr:IS3 family transposase [Gammaproteobacteria bacterium]